MDIILKKDVEGLGHKDDIIKVKPGYGRNYLIPKELAIIASDSNKKALAERLKQADSKLQKIEDEARNIAKKIGNLILTIEAKVSASGKIFGSITSTQVYSALKSKGFSIDRKKIHFDPIKTPGEYSVVLSLHKNIEHQLKINVVAV